MSFRARSVYADCVPTAADDFDSNLDSDSESDVFCSDVPNPEFFARNSRISERTPSAYSAYVRPYLSLNHF